MRQRAPLPWGCSAQQSAGSKPQPFLSPKTPLLHRPIFGEEISGRRARGVPPIRTVHMRFCLEQPNRQHQWGSRMALLLLVSSKADVYLNRACLFVKQGRVDLAARALIRGCSCVRLGFQLKCAIPLPWKAGHR